MKRFDFSTCLAAVGGAWASLQSTCQKPAHDDGGALRYAATPRDEGATLSRSMAMSGASHDPSP
jgi:hypothetical protein